MVKAGDVAPDFRLPDQDGNEVSLKDYAGKWVVLYFYPKDDTPGCTTEACNFRDNIYAFRAIGANVIGRGIRMQSRVMMQRGGRLNETVNRQIESAWLSWGHARSGAPGCPPVPEPTSSPSRGWREGSPSHWKITWSKRTSSVVSKLRSTTRLLSNSAEPVSWFQYS